MFDEKVFIAQVEQAQAEEFADIMTRPSAEQEKALRAHLGDHRYQRMHAMALRGNVTRAAGLSKGNVLVLHGSMGSELSLIGPNERTQIWVHALRLMDGQLSRLRMAESRTGRVTSENIHATGIMKRHYGELLLTLAQQWSVRAFWYDWRRGVEYAALRLQGLLADWFDERDPIHFVAHGLGGLVVRALIQRDPARWEGCLATGETGNTGGRLVMLGTPHHGSFTVPQLLAGIDPLTRQLARLDRRHDESEVQAVVSSFAGLYEMLPSPVLMPQLEPLFKAETYAPARVSQRHLDTALLGYQSRHDPPDDGRLVQVVGLGQPTLSGLTDPSRVRDPEAYRASFAGDGRVLLDLAELRTSGGSGQPVRTYYVEENHGTLTANEQVLGALDELLETGATSLLDDRRPAGEELGRDARTGLRKAGEKCAANLLQRVERLRVRATRDASAGVGYVTFDERVAEELITRDVLSSPVKGQAANLEMPPPGKIELAVEHKLIHDPDLRSGELPIDAIAVGHYEQVKPAGAELQLDQAISGALGPAGAAKANGGASQDSGILTQYTERGIIRGELGQPFFLPDPRVPPDGPGGGRLIVLAGMGAPGRFGAPELTVLARELCWSLGRMGKKHLATLLIGSGYGNLAEAEAVEAWIRGIKHAVSGSIEGDDRKLQRITFIEADGAKIRGIQDAILEAKRRLKEQERLEIEYRRLPVKQLESIKTKNLVAERPRPEPADPPPTRISYTFNFGSFRFGAITQDASIPEREIPLDGKLVEQANNELAGEWNPTLQLERGRFLERLLVPRDLRDQLSTPTPIVMSVDATTARIHWELLAQPEFSDVEGLEGQAAAVEPGRDFLGTTRGLTRQLRTTFAPPPEPPPPPGRVLRVLVVADPAEDAPLRGAQEEGVEVADLFSAFNMAHGSAVESKVLVTALLGPREATRTNVLRHLMLHSFDVLHFAGHATYNPDTNTSGWVFSDGELVTANELNRIDRIPKFVFSNACESGITPDRSEQRSVDLAPNFAESFFARGVSSFVCTAWPVEDVAARMFALTLYQQLLGLSPTSGQSNRYGPVTPEPMHVAMQRARLRVARPPFAGSRTWGAYQHYGNPFFRLFQASMLTGRRRASARRPKPGSQETETKLKPSAAASSLADASPSVPAAPPPAGA
jgi:pimeloyl-ACP methyl ester carboxylesterase